MFLCAKYNNLSYITEKIITQNCMYVLAINLFDLYVAMYILCIFGKTNHLCNLIVLRNVNLKNSLSYNSTIVSSRSTGLALEIQHLFSFK